MNDFTEFLTSFLTILFGGGNPLQDALNQTHTVSQSSALAFRFAGAVNAVAVKPVSALIFCIMLMLELSNISQKFEGKEVLWPMARFAIKVMLLLWAIVHSDRILGAMRDIAEWMITKAERFTSSIDPTYMGVSVQVEKTTVLGTIGGMLNPFNSISSLILVLLLIIIFLVSTVVKIILIVVTTLRFVELAVMTSMASLPFIFLSHPDTKSIGIGFLRKYAGVALQGVMIIMVILIYGAIMKSFGANITLNPVSPAQMVTEIMKNFVQLLVAPVLLGFLLVSSGRFARSIMGE